MNCNTLAFEGTKFDVVDRNGRPWLRSPQIAGALGYNRADRIYDLYTRNADEFTDSMTAVVDLDTAGGRQKVRIFSLRGAHLLAMFSRTKVAKAFRRWVLDVLDREVASQRQTPPPPEGAVIISAAGLERFRQDLRRLREVALAVAGALRPLVGRSSGNGGSEVGELWTRADELPLSWEQLKITPLSLPVADCKALPVAQPRAPALPGLVGEPVSELEAVRRKLLPWAAAQPKGFVSTTAQMASLVLGIPPDAVSAGDTIRLGLVLRELRWRKVRAAADSGRYWAYQKPRH